MPKIFVSDAIGHERLTFAPPARPGPARPGWMALSRLYQDSFAACGFRVAQLLRPDIYLADEARAVLGAEPGDWHLAVKPVEHLRPFHGLPNVFVCDWPFPELSSRTLGGSPFFNQIRLLQLADAVLCPTGFTADVLRRAGVTRVVQLPPHVPPGAGFAAAGPAEQVCRFLCVVEQGSLPRQLGATLEGFAAASAGRCDLHLTVRLRGGGGAGVAALRDRAAYAAAGCAVTVEGDGPGGAEPEAHFFLSAHAAPGLHLPLVEAMGAGLPAVTTVSAGTASFLPSDAAVPVATRPDTLDGDGEPIGRFMPLTSHPATAAAVRDAVRIAAAMDAAARARMGAAARAEAAARFGPGAFRDGLPRLQAALARTVA